MNGIAIGLSALLVGQISQCALAAEGLKWEVGPGHRRAKLNVPAAGKTGFTLLSPEALGIRWTNFIAPDRYAARQNLMNGSGLAAGDYDGDGWCDLYLCNKEGPNGLFRNLGNWKFENVTARAGVACTNQTSTGAVFADINGDARLDLLVTSFTGPNACFLNLGDGRFTNITSASGLNAKGGCTSMALGDMDGDNDLDLYVCYFGIEAILRDGGAYSYRMVNGQPRVTGQYAKRLTIADGRIMELGEPDIYYVNDGKGRFSPVDWKQTFRDENGQGMAPQPDFGLAVQIRDINGDGFPDIYICNDFQTPDRLWLNDGRGRFRAVERLALRNMSYASMGADFADIDRDGRLDFFAVEMLSRDHTRLMNQSSPVTQFPRVIGAIENREEVPRNTLYWNRGDGTYAELAFYSGLAASDWSWTPIFIDVDLDGYEDVLVSNGHLHDVNDRDVQARRRSAPNEDKVKAPLQYPRLDTPKAAFHNQRDLTFADVSAAWGFDSRDIAHGMVLADLDNDGDAEVIANCQNAAPLIYRNDSAANRLAVRLKGASPNTQGIGGKITVSGGPVTQTQEIICGGRYLSGDDPVRVFATGTSNNSLKVEVTWRNGKRSVVPQALHNHLYEIDESAAEIPQPSENAASPAKMRPAPDASTKVSAGTSLFRDVSSLISHTHTEQPYDDFARQPLLPKKLSQPGPSVVWFDLDDDGNDELIVGSGKGGSLAVYRNDGKGGFSRLPSNVPSMPAAGDLTGIVAMPGSAGRKSTLWVGLCNYETAATNLPSVLQYEYANGAFSETLGLPAMPSSVGPLALADIDADGDLDLFVGGRVIAGRYPEPATSALFRNANGKFALDAENSRAFEKIGLITAALFSDVNGDGEPDLILACEWGPIRLLQNNQGTFQDVTAAFGLAGLVGSWNSVTAGDLNGDGLMDIIAGNWGLNSLYHRAPQGPWHLYYGDFNADAQVHLLEGYLNLALQKIIPWRDMALVGAVLPWVPERLTSHKVYGRSTVAQILGDRNATQLQANTLASTVFLNRGEKFEAAPLPPETQWAPALGLAVADLDGDGNEDVLVAQNFFAVRTEDNRCDAGRGLWLRGDGKGGLKAVPGQESGVTVYGEQRGCAVGDYDKDGRADLAITQNGAATKLYQNAGAKPGLRVRLKGVDQNPGAVGASARLIFGERAGPSREIRTGSGYWSQDSLTMVLGTPEEPTGIWVRWPGGKTTKSNIPKGAKEITVAADGGVR